MAKETKTTVGPQTKADVRAAREAVFDQGLFEIPDDCVVGHLKHKLDALQARVDHLSA